MDVKAVAGILERVETKGGSLVLRLLTRHIREQVHEIIVTLGESDVAKLRAALDRIDVFLSAKDKGHP